MANVDLHLAEAGRALMHVKVLLEHAFGITSYQSFRQLSEMSQLAYMNAVRERVNAAEDAIECAKDAPSDVDDADDVDEVPSKRRRKPFGWEES